MEENPGGHHGKRDELPEEVEEVKERQLPIAAKEGKQARNNVGIPVPLPTHMFRLHELTN